jgi:hypothetical protein
MPQPKPGPPPQSPWPFTLNVNGPGIAKLGRVVPCSPAKRIARHGRNGAPKPGRGRHCNAQPMQRREKASSRNARYNWVEKGAEMADIYVTVARSYGTHKRVVSVTPLERFE